jgi:hypothetical protein
LRCLVPAAEQPQGEVGFLTYKLDILGQNLSARVIASSVG